MNYLIGILTAIWLGIMTSISPCPLATNIAAISFIGRRVDSLRRVFLAGVLYTAGRATTYLALGVILVSSVLNVPDVSAFLQRYMNRILGPVLILAGMFLLELISLNLPGGRLAGSAQSRVEKHGIWGAGILGIIFALTFCPVSAALFFGGLIPLSLKFKSRVILPSLFGLGTGLPVLMFAILIAVSTKSVGNMFDKVTLFEWWGRRITGAIFIVVGIYYCLNHIFGIFT